MIREIIHDPIFLQQKSREATPEDLPVAADLQDTLCACMDRCAGMAANMIGEKIRIIAFCPLYFPLNGTITFRGNIQRG